MSKMTTTMTTTPDGRLGSTANEHPPQPLPDEFGELRHLLMCDNPLCVTKGPTIQCERCKEQYYCSVHCQKAHWNTGGHKHACFCFDASRDQWLAAMACSPTATEPLGSVDSTVVATGSKSDPTTSPLNTCCGICLEAINSPVILPSCGHVFCFSCLAEYQGRLGPDDLTYFIDPDAHGGFPKKTCPYCRTAMETSIVSEAIDKSNRYTERALCLLDSNVVECNELYRLASVEVEKVLAVDPHYVIARGRKGHILMHQDPVQAIRYIQETMEIERVESEKFRDFFGWVGQIGMARALGHVSLYHQLLQEFTSTYKRHFDLPKVAGHSLGRLDLHMCLAQAYEEARQYENALDEYATAGKLMEDVHEPDDVQEVSAIFEPELALGRSRSLYHLGDHVNAIKVAFSLLAQTRSYPGVHKLVALPLLAIATDTEYSLLPRTFFGYEATLDGAIAVMYKGYVYEAQYDSFNKEKNRLFLQELYDKKAGSSPVERPVTPITFFQTHKQKAGCGDDEDDRDIARGLVAQFHEATVSDSADSVNDSETSSSLAPQGPSQTRRRNRGKKGKKKRR